MGRRRDAAEIARDRRRVADLYLQGWLQTDIAADLGIDQSTVSRDLKALQGAWLHSALLDFNEAKAQQLAKIDRLEREYWEAWARSCQAEETITQRTKGEVERRKDEKTGKFVDTRPAELTKAQRDRTGDPRFLQGVQWCIDRRIKILGVDSAQKLDIGDLTIHYTGNVNPDDL